MEQTRVWSHRAVTNTVTARVLLEARAGEVPLLKGYKMDLFVKAGSAFSNFDEDLFTFAVLQANPLAPQVPIDMVDAVLDGFLKHRGTFGFVGLALESSGPTNVSSWVMKPQETTGWIPMDEEVPGVWLVMSVISDGATPIPVVAITLKFDWVKRSALEVASLYTQFGIDPVDATERSATLDIDFNRTPGTERPLAVIG